MAIDIESPGANEAALKAALKDLIDRPTRTTVTLSGASTDVAIPAGVTRFVLLSGVITLTAGGNSVYAALRHTGNTVEQTWSGFDLTGSLSAGAVSGGTGFVYGTPTSTTRRLFADVSGPRDSSKPTIANSRGVGAAANIRTVWSESAQDHDTLRFVCAGGGTFSGTVEIMWFYN